MLDKNKLAIPVGAKSWQEQETQLVEAVKSYVQESWRVVPQELLDQLFASVGSIVGQGRPNRLQHRYAALKYNIM